MASETMTVQEAIELCEPNDARASAEQWLTAMAVLVAHARATTAGTGAEQRFVCGGTPTTDGQKELDDFATYLRVKGRIDAQQKLAPQGVTVTEAMVEVACAAFSREWYEDVEARPMRVALTAALRAAGVGA